MEGLKKLEELEARFGELSEQMADPALVQDQTAYRKIAKSHSDLSEVVDKFQAWKSLQSEIESTRPMVEEANAEMAEMVDNDDLIRRLRAGSREARKRKRTVVA